MHEWKRTTSGNIIEWNLFTYWRYFWSCIFTGCTSCTQFQIWSLSCSLSPSCYDLCFFSLRSTTWVRQRNRETRWRAIAAILFLLFCRLQCERTLIQFILVSGVKWRSAGDTKGSPATRASLQLCLTAHRWIWHCAGPVCSLPACLEPRHMDRTHTHTQISRNLYTPVLYVAPVVL